MVTGRSRKKLGRSSLYDVALNLDTISVESAVDIIEHLSQLKEYTADEETQQNLNDLLISSNVWAALSKKKSTRLVQVSIQSCSGHVTIHGDVNSRKISESVLDIAKGVEGVKTVENNIRVGIKWIW